jgi:uncharacterized iron-regulated membrane protein
MSWCVARPHDNELIHPRRPAVKMGPLLGASALALVVLGILALLAGKGVEPFGGSVSVLAGLLCGSTLVVVGLAGVARRNAGHRAGAAAARRDTPEARPVDRSDPPDDRAQRVDDTRVMGTVAVGLPPPPVPPRRPSVLRTVAGPDR